MVDCLFDRIVVQYLDLKSGSRPLSGSHTQFVGMLRWPGRAEVVI